MAKIDRLLEQARDHMDDGERVDASILGSYETKVLGADSVRIGVMIATERRVVFYAKKLTGYDFESFPYANISSFESGKNLMGRHFKFFASGNAVTLKWIKDGDADEFAAIVRERAGVRAPKPAAAAPSATDQVRELAKLRDEGILTADEFEAKKRQLLGL